MTFSMSIRVFLTVMLFGTCCCFLLSTVQSTAKDCSINCTCTHYFICSKRSLQTVPWIPKIPSCNIDLSDNHIVTIQAGMFKNQSTNQFCSINLDNNNIHAVNDAAFNWIMNVSITIFLRQNKLSSIPKAFGKLTKLEALYLSENPLMHFNAETMINIGRSLTTFSFDMGQFQTWPHELQFLREIRKLKIGYIPFRSIPQSAFHGIENTLINLHIHNSKLEYFPHALCTLHTMLTLNFSSNHYLDEINSGTMIPCTNNRFQVYNLYFNDNNLNMFPNLQTLFPSISLIQANNNGFFVMDGDSFVSANFTVNELHLNMNKFSRIPFAVNNLQSLHKLYMAYNSIVSIDEFDIPKLKDLYVLDLKGNPILYISQRSFIKNLKLKSLDLSETMLHKIPAAVMSLSSLNDLKLSSTQIVCTCDMAYLKDWGHTSVISDTSLCHLSTEKIKDFLQKSLTHC